jgi:Fe-S-cluster containining protein
MDFSEAANQLVPEFDRIYDQWSKDSTALLADFQIFNPTQGIQCSKGCGACCHFPLISATAGEAFVVLVKLFGTGQSFAAISQNVMAYADNYLAKATALGGLPFTDDMQRKFMNSNSPCPFFVKETDINSASLTGHCGIFNIRPSICESYHSTDIPSLCALKQPHGMISSLIEKTDDSTFELRHAERSLFGRSTVGHFPLLLASLCTQQGLDSFLKEIELEPELDEAGNHDWASAQHMTDFDLYVELMASIGYKVTSQDIHNLIAAQGDLQVPKPPNFEV